MFEQPIQMRYLN